ncbi:molybdenum cofactor biosynthesis protein MoaE [Sphingomonas japonica]|uniref:Molybdopterin synthase catalytic subunit n=1 Tax=Sphingomonas japonica TaxID=511662 RepID=A0ABX0TXA5_9SPHN|nr:molybdenum cofactor biosynthesis protein MoaE [Sphingomonas japonica]NIJ22929.1 molybdopterin synthase catalytic subunit [Sphingomonas japonica]
MIRAFVQAEPIDLADALAGVEASGAGGVASFTGIVRNDDGVSALTLEHYPGMTEAALKAVAREAQGRWNLLAITIIHRVGTMYPGDRIVFVAAAAAHREPALAACAFAIDRLKTGAPFWKREQRGDAVRWVEPRAADDAAATRWDDG